ncbi:g4026 [Coccomyxa elongata]
MESCQLWRRLFDFHSLSGDWEKSLQQSLEEAQPETVDKVLMWVIWSSSSPVRSPPQHPKQKKAETKVFYPPWNVRKAYQYRDGAFRRDTRSCEEAGPSAGSVELREGVGTSA